MSKGEDLVLAVPDLSGLSDLKLLGVLEEPDLSGQARLEAP
jgi:hypothetical protein